MKVDEIRQAYLNFFVKKNHPIIASDSLVPQNDPSLLFTGAGMNQFKENFLGVKKDLKCATSSQKCIRTGDLEEVGRTAYHHSFFEMLGNFSFGDYFKEGAIQMAWEFLTKDLKLDPKRLRISVHHSDDEAFALWRDKIGIRPDWIYKLGDKDNFWPSNAPTDGPNGPCGPCSEIYYDQNPSLGDGGDLEQTFTDTKGTHKRFAEIWNLVFTQYDRQDGGKLIPLAQKNIDTGMGLERLACMLQGKATNYEIDTLAQINQAVAKRLGITQTEKNKNRIYAITDHIRGIVFCMSDGVIPSNEGRGYVLRKLIRRALWHGREAVGAELNQPFLCDLVKITVQVMSQPYPELKDAEQSVTAMLRGEEQRFLETLDRGLEKLNNKIDELAKNKKQTLPGEFVFELYDTYGFPDELTKKIAAEKNFEVDQDGFNKAMEAQKKRAKDSSKMKGEIFATTDLEKALGIFPATRFHYDRLEDSGQILYQTFEGKNGIIVLDQTPFYGESGGQVGDTGKIENEFFKAVITDTQKKDKYILHYAELISGQPKDGQGISAYVDKNRRERTMRNHTATHLLHAALREILGPQVRQLGSLVSPDKLRFDYSYGQALTPEQLRQIEDKVNSEILKNTALTKEEKAIEEAKKDGAIAFFGEKYGAKVRVVTVPGFSKEFCGGTHCDRTGQIGFFVITSESSIASGTRRMEALTGEGGLEYVRSLRSQINQLAQAMKTTPDQLGERIAKLQDSFKKLEKEKSRTVAVDPDKILASAKKEGNLQYAVYCDKELKAEELRTVSDQIRSKAGKLVYFLGAENEEKISFILGSSPDLGKTDLDIRDLAKQLAGTLGASGGGRKDLVQGGGPNQGQFRENQKIETVIADWIKKSASAIKG